jgi:hypothetical protein
MQWELIRIIVSVIMPCFVMRPVGKPVDVRMITDRNLGRICEGIKQEKGWGPFLGITSESAKRD